MQPTPPDPQAPLLFIARQAGSAAAFGPLIDALIERGQRPLLVALGAARDAWSERTALRGTSFSELEERLEREAKPRLVITGTSAEALDDAKSWAWAKERGVRSWAFVDSWVNYAARFQSKDAWVRPLPDCIITPDTNASRGLIDAGLPERSIRALGSPAFDEVLRAKSPRPSQLKGIRLLFASQPLAGRGLPDAWDEHRALDMLFETLEGLSLGVPMTLVLRAHPAEAKGVFDRRLKRAPSRSLMLEIDAGETRTEAIKEAHVVLGVVSMLMVEAQWMGRPALSLQPGFPADSDLLRLHDIQVCSDKGALEDALKEALSMHWKAPPSPSLALPRWIRALEEEESSRR